MASSNSAMVQGMTISNDGYAVYQDFGIKHNPTNYVGQTNHILEYVLTPNSLRFSLA